MSRKSRKSKNCGIDFRTSYNGKGMKEVTNAINQLQKEIEKLQGSFQKAKDKGEEVKKSFFTLENVFKLSVLKKATDTFIKLGTSVLKASSDMTELQNVTDQVFENMAKDIENFSVKSGEAMGRSTYAMRKYASDIGAILKGLGGIDDTAIKNMSQELAKSSVDIGSFNNIEDSQAFTAITAGLVGETEPLKRLGIVINETVMKEYALAKGYKEAWETMDASTKSYLRYQAILEKTSFMQGDAERTINSFANQLKVLEANMNNLAVGLGNKAIPMANGILKIINSVTSAMAHLASKKKAIDFSNEYAEELTNVKALQYEYKALSEQSVKTLADRKRMTDIIETLKAQYPTELANVDSLTASYDDLANAVNKVNNSLKEKIVLSLNEYYNNEMLKITQDTQKSIRNFGETINQEAQKIISKYKLQNNNSAKNGNWKKVYEELAKNTANREALDYDFTNILTAVDLQKKELAKAKQKAETLLKTQQTNFTALTEMNENFSNIADAISEQNAKLLNQTKLEGQKNRLQQAKLEGTLVTTVTNATTKTTDTIIGNNLGLTAKETLEILKNRGVISQFINGVNKTYKMLENGNIEESSNGYKVDKYGRYQKITKQYTSKEFENILKGELKKDIGNTLKNTKTNVKTGGSSSSKAKELNKFEKLLESLNNALNDLNLTVNPKMSTKIKEASIKLRKAQDDISIWLYNLSELDTSELIKEKIKHLEDELKTAIELKDSEAVQKIRDSIKKLEVENIIPSIVSNIEKELNNKITELEGKSKGFDSKDLEKLKQKIENFKEKNIVELKDKLSNNLITQEQYNKSIIDLSNQAISYYEKLGLSNEKIKEQLTASKMTLQSILNAVDKQLIYANVESALNGNSDSEIKQNITNVYKNAVNKIWEKIKEDIESFNLNEEDIKTVNKLMVSNNREFTSLSKSINENGSEALKSILNMILKLKEFQLAEKKSKELKGFDLANKAVSDIGSSLKNIASGIKGESAEFFNELADTFNTLGNIMQNIKSAKDSIATGGISGILGSFGAIGGAIGGVISIVSSIFSIFKADEGKIKAAREHEKAKVNWSKDLRNSNNNLRNSIDNLSSDVKNFNNTLIKNAALNTSNANLKLNSDIANEVARIYANSFNATVKTRISRTKESYRWWGLSRDTQYLGTEDKEEDLRKIINIPEFKNAKDLMEWYRSIKDTTYKAKFDSLGSGSSGLFGFKGYSHTEKLVGSNYNDVIEMIPAFARTVEEINKLSQNIQDYSVLESFEGVSFTSANDKKDGLRQMLKKLAEASGQDYSKMAGAIEQKLDELIKTDDVIITAFDDVRNSFVQRLAQGSSVIDGLAAGLQGYFNKIRTNIAKIKYDLEFRENKDLEKNFIEKFKFISEELKRIRLENGKTLKDLDPKALDFKSLFKQMKDLEKVSKDMTEIIKNLREQARAEGISEEIIDQMLPLDKIKEKTSSVSEMLKNAMSVALDTDSFSQFSMSLGDSIYKNVKEGLLQAFAESENYKKLAQKFLISEDFNTRFDKAQTLEEAYNIMKDELDKAETILKSKGLGFRETDASSGEYLGGFSNKAAAINNNFSTASSGINITITNNIDNKGFLAVDDMTEMLTEKLKQKIENSKKREV